MHPINEVPASGRKLRRLLVAMLMVLAIAIGVVVWSRGSRKLSVEEAKGAMRPLWQDNYQHLSEGYPPWPRGISAEQDAVLRRANEIVIATIDPYAHDAGHFHRCDVLGARVYHDSDRVAEIIGRLKGCIREDGWWAQEFYPAFAARITARDEGGAADVVDLLIGPHYRGMYVLTPKERRFCAIDDAEAKELIYKLASGLPRKYEYE
jgi:hypothetical protein